MLKIFIKILLCVFSLPHFSIPSSHEKKIEQVENIYCTDELKEAFSVLREMPEVNNLIDRILEKGPLSIEINHHMPQKFDGYWSAGDRTIYVTNTGSKSGFITTILFEMHNAANDAELKHFDNFATHGQIKRKEYIRSVEHWEYKNVKATVAILNKGIDKGLFPEQCYWPLSNNFEEHFRIQKSAGHSAHIGEMYDSLT